VDALAISIHSTSNVTINYSFKDQNSGLPHNILFILLGAIDDRRVQLQSVLKNYLALRSFATKIKVDKPILVNKKTY
jgi:hypothetical protein